MLVTRESVAERLTSFLHDNTPLSELVDWAERAIMDGQFEDGHERDLMEVLGRIGAADVRNFGLLWTDCVELLRKLGYEPSVEIRKVS